MRLGLFTDRSVAYRNETAWSRAPDGRLMQALRERCESLTVAASVAPKVNSTHDFNLAEVDLRLIDRPYVPSIARGFLDVRSTRRFLRQIERCSDVVLVQMPIASVAALFRPRTPRVYQMAADVRTVVHNSTYYRGLKRFAAVGAVRFFDRCHTMLVQSPGSRMICHGRELLERYGADRGQSVVSSPIFREEVLSVTRTRSADAPFRVLYVGFLRHEKGVDVLIESFERLLDRVARAELVIVGATDYTDHGVSGYLQNAIDRLDRRASIVLAGHCTLGPELFLHYADADVCVVPSRGGEGTPRVLVEARAFGCPVIGTTVGGIPDSIRHEHDGLLVPPGDVESLTAALIRMATDAPLRRRLIDAGVERARRTTIDDFAEAILCEARKARSEIISAKHR